MVKLPVAVYHEKILFALICSKTSIAEFAIVLCRVKNQLAQFVVVFLQLKNLIAQFAVVLFNFKFLVAKFVTVLFCFKKSFAEFALRLVNCFLNAQFWVKVMTALMAEW